MSTGDAYASSCRPSRIATIVSHKNKLASDVAVELGLAEDRLRKMKANFEGEVPALPEEGAERDVVAEAEGILWDTHCRFEMCAKSVKDAVAQARNIDATTGDSVLRTETRANLMDLRDQYAQLKHDRSVAEGLLRAQPGFSLRPSLIITLLEAERETERLRYELGELQGEYALALDTIHNYEDHTHLRLTRRIQVPRVPLPDDGRRCEMCGAGFPASDAQISPCGHFYHIFCLAIQVAMVPECCRQTCREDFPPYWLETYGFPCVAVTESEMESIPASSSSGVSVSGKICDTPQAP